MPSRDRSRSLRGWFVAREQHRASVLPISVGPRGVGERLGDQEAAVRAIEHVENPFRLAIMTTLRVRPSSVMSASTRNFVGVPVVGVMGRELVVPFQRAGVGSSATSDPV